MRVMRSSAYMDMHHPPLTVVLRDSDVIDTLESIHHGGQNDDTFVVADIFDMPDANIADATVEALRRFDDAVKRREQDMAIRYFWVVQMLPLINTNGVILSDKPAPLTRDELAYVEERIAAHSNYDGQTTIVFDETGARYEFKNGKEVTT